MTTRPRSQAAVILCEDDVEHCEIIEKAWAESGLSPSLIMVKDGAELFDYLYSRGAYEDRKRTPRPQLILLDLKMPRMDGLEVLEVIKKDPDLRSTPVIVLTVSEDQEDVLRSYNLGVNAYMTKPSSFSEMTEAFRRLGAFWLQVARLPAE